MGANEKAGTGSDFPLRLGEAGVALGSAHGRATLETVGAVGDAVLGDGPQLSQIDAAMDEWAPG
jgi:hypothetical protein